MSAHTALPSANESPKIATSDAWNIDWQTVVDDLGGDEGLLTELIEVYLATLPATLNEARAAVAQGDLTAVARAAHKLKGTVGNFGLGPAWKATRTLEESAKGKQLTETRVAFAAAEQEYARLEERLRSRLRIASA